MLLANHPEGLQQPSMCDLESVERLISMATSKKAKTDQIRGFSSIFQMRYVQSLAEAISIGEDRSGAASSDAHRMNE